MDPTDERLDALLERAAPDGAAPGLGGPVVAAVRARQRGRRLRLAILGAAAVVALGLVLGGYLRAKRPERVVSDVVPRAPAPAAPTPGAEETAPESFAVQFESAGESGQRVMMARINGTYLLVARPNDEMVDELEELLRVPASMTGFLSSAKGGGSLAVRLR